MNADNYLAAERSLFADAGIEPTERWITPADGVRTRILEHGEGTPTVFWHGGPNAAATWAYLAGATAGLRCLLVDRPGCGLSDPPRAVPDNGTVGAYVTELTRNVLDGLGLDRAALVGSSFGGYSVLRSAIELPDRVTRIVLAGCPAFVPGWTAPSFFSILRTPMLGKLVLRLPANAAALRMSVRQLGHGYALDRGLIPSAMLDWMLAWQRHTDTMTNDAAMIIACGTWRGGFDPALDLTPIELAGIAAPCLILGGTNDPVGGTDVVQQLAAAVPHGSSEQLPHAGHLPWLDDPVWAADRLSAFLADT